MDLKDIQNLIKFVAKSGASEVKLEMDDVKITIKTGSERNNYCAANANAVKCHKCKCHAAPPVAAAPAPAAPAEAKIQNI